jgi:hypothetical protein
MADKPFRTHDDYPARKNPDGSYSSEVTVTTNNPKLNRGQWTNIPSLWKGKEVSEDEAVENVNKTERKYPSFGSEKEAVDSAIARSSRGGAGQIDKGYSTYNTEDVRTGSYAKGGQVGRVGSFGLKRSKPDFAAGGGVTNFKKWSK